MRSQLLGVVLLALLLTCAPTHTARSQDVVSEGGETDPIVSARAALAGIDGLLRSRLSQPELEGTDVSVLVQSLDGQVLYERKADVPFAPASNMKIVTGACALSRLGPGYRFATDIGTDGELREGVLGGNLYVRGSGDPSLVSEELWKICERLRARGIRRVDGDLVLDASRFDDVQTPTDEADDGDRAYHARTGALSLNFNSITVHVYPGESRGHDAVVSVSPEVGIVELRNNAQTGSSRRGSTINVRRRLEDGRNVVRVTGRVPDGSGGRTFYRNLDDPTGCFGRAFRGFLSGVGIELSGQTRVGVYPEDVSLLYSHESKALSLIVRDLGKYSNNFVAEQLVKTLSAELLGPPGTTEGGTRIISDYLTEVGADSGSFRVVDGSGLARDNRLTTRTIVRVIDRVLRDFETSYEFVASLSVSGVDGTLDDRMGFPGLRGSVRAKTGLLDGVTAISGVLRTVAGDEVIFSVITNGSSCEAWHLHDLEHEILAHVARQTPRLGGD